MTHLLASLLSALLLALGFGGCTNDSGTTYIEDPGPPAYAVGTLLVSWSQSDFPDLDRELSPGPRLITTEEGRARLLGEAPAGADTTRVSDVDLTESVIVVGDYFACQEIGGVWGDGHRVWLDAPVPRDGQDTVCGWSPFTVDVFEVPRSAFGGEVALVPPPWGDER